MRLPKVPKVLLTGADDVWSLRRAAAAYLRRLRSYLGFSGEYHIRMGDDTDPNVLGTMVAGKRTFTVLRQAVYDVDGPQSVAWLRHKKMLICLKGAKDWQYQSMLELDP